MQLVGDLLIREFLEIAFHDRLTQRRGQFRQGLLTGDLDPTCARCPARGLIDVDVFREEVRLTYLHELGHYLGWDEDELTARGLD